MEQFQVRTDLALEAAERFEEEVEIRGVLIEEEYDEKKDIRVTTVRIETENGARAMGKPVGVYITLEAPKLSEPDEDYHREVSETLAVYLRELLGTGREKSVLVVCFLLLAVFAIMFIPPADQTEEPQNQDCKT